MLNRLRILISLEAFGTFWKARSPSTGETGERNVRARVDFVEGPGQHHPAGSMAADNPTDKTTRILLVEWVPVN